MTAQEYLATINAQKNKYHARKVHADGMTFDSESEYCRYRELKIMERAGEIRRLERQKVFQLIPDQKDASGKVVERACNYKADFCYTTSDGKYVVEDVKGVKTKEYRIKKKLMLFVYGIQISEVSA